ncbi:MAG: AAA family ATPase [Proteobacteria bacterium]|nr:AAA family ATPase [Pseudomonadota bacterium]
MNWPTLLVMLVRRNGDTRKDSGKSYDQISLMELFALAGNPSAEAKGAGSAIIPSDYNGFDARAYKAQRQHGRYTAICGDIDNGNHSLEALGELVDAYFGPVATLIYSTSNATPENKRWRAIVPLEQPLSFQEWYDASMAFYAYMTANGVLMDRCMARPAQLVYTPNVPLERRGPEGKPLFYEYEVTDGPGADPSFPVFSKWTAKLREQREADEQLRDAARAEASAARQELGTSGGGGGIGAFNAANGIRDLLAKYGYVDSPQRDDDWRSPHQTSNSYATRDFGDHWVSLSESDKTAGLGIETKSGARTGDAFDLYCHYEHGGDFIAALRAAATTALIDPARLLLARLEADAAAAAGAGADAAGAEASADAASSPRYKLLTAAEMAGRPPVEWLVSGVLPRTGLAAIYGPSGSGKSFLALDMFCAIDRGVPWFGRKTKKAPITYICLEGAAGLGQRMAAYLKRFGTLSSQIRVVVQPMNLLTAADVADMAHAILTAGMAGGVVCIDTLNRASPGADENAPKDMGQIIYAAQQLQLLVGGVVVLVHHTGKDESRGLRGHTSLAASLDAAIGVSRTKTERTWFIGKSKDGNDDLEGTWQLETITLGTDEDGETISSCVVQPASSPAWPSLQPLSAYAKQAVAAYQACSATVGGKGVHIDLWREAFYQSTTATTDAARRKAFQRARDELSERGLLVVDGDLNHLTDEGIGAFTFASQTLSSILIPALAGLQS